jgi:pectinesterase
VQSAAEGGRGGSFGAAGSADGTAGSSGASGGTAGSDAAAGSPAAGSGEPRTCDRTSAGASVPTLYVIGDSTASVYSSELSPRTGWAQVLPDYFASGCAKVSDKALSGRSSKSFYDEGSWTPIRTALRAGDTVLVQFAHNDEKDEDPARYTEPFTTFTQYLEKYIDEAQAKGATVLLLTPIARNKWSGTRLTDTHGDYPVAMRQLAQKRTLALVDMTALTTAYFERIGPAMTDRLFLNLAAGESPNYPNGNSDDTHLQERGARAVCQLALADIYAQGLPLGNLLKAAPKAP